MRRRYLVALATLALSAALAPAAMAESCPSVANPAALAGTGKLRSWNRALDNFGVRTTGSPNHVRYVDWLERQLGSIRGVEVHSLRYRFHRWLARSASLRVTIGRQVVIRPAGPVPYSKPSAAHGPPAPLVHLPADTDITAANSAGKLVVRDLVGGSLPNAAFNAVAWSIFDPRHTLDPDGVYKRDWLNPQPTEDMEAAGEAGAAGVLFVARVPALAGPRPLPALRGHPLEGAGAAPRSRRGRAAQAGHRERLGRAGPDRARGQDNPARAHAHAGRQAGRPRTPARGGRDPQRRCQRALGQRLGADPGDRALLRRAAAPLSAGPDGVRAHHRAPLPAPRRPFATGPGTSSTPASWTRPTTTARSSWCWPWSTWARISGTRCRAAAGCPA